MTTEHAMNTYRSAYRRKLRRDRIINAISILTAGAAFGTIIGLLALKGGV